MNERSNALAKQGGQGRCAKECRINTNTRALSQPGGRPRGEGLAPPLRPTHTNPARCRGGGRWGMLP